MGPLFRFLIGPLIRSPIFKPVLRFVIGLIAIPFFRFFLQKVVRLQDMDKELEKDLEQWFRGSLLLLVATRNMEDDLFGWIEALITGEHHEAALTLTHWWGQVLTALRIMLAIGVTEAMPDQELFAIIYPGPPKLKFEKGRFFQGIREQAWPVVKGLACRHMDRSTQVFAIASAIFPGTAGWFCYFMAITQYLIIGLVTSRSRAMDALEKFDQEVQRRRDKLKEQISDTAHFGDDLPRPAPFETISPPQITGHLDAASAPQEKTDP